MNKTRVLTVIAAFALTLVLYAALGFFLVPSLVKQRLVAHTEHQLKHRLSLGEVRFNPFTFGMEVNDLPLAVRYGQPMRELVDCFDDAVTAARRAPSAGLIDVTIHAHVGARPIGLLALERIVDSARENECWLATRAEVAAASGVIGSLET